jgi:hypothetical protein
MSGGSKMQIEITVNNKKEIQNVHLHDVLLEEINWSIEAGIVSFKLSNWEWDNEGALELRGVVYSEMSSFSPWGGVPFIYEGYVDDSFNIADGFLRIINEGNSKPEDCRIPDANRYFCFAILMRSGDIARFVVEKLIWKPAEKQ